MVLSIQQREEVATTLSSRWREEVATAHLIRWRWWSSLVIMVAEVGKDGVGGHHSWSWSSCTARGRGRRAPLVVVVILIVVGAKVAHHRPPHPRQVQ
jgi:hypothetical protein